MKVLTPAVNGLLLCGVNIFFVLAGFVAFGIFQPGSQLLIQLPIAFGGSVLGFVLVDHAMHLRGWLPLRDGRQRLLTYIAAFVWFPLIFMPLHYFTQGYVSAFSNVASMWFFQAIANGIALLVVHLQWEESQASKVEKAA